MSIITKYNGTFKPLINNNYKCYKKDISKPTPLYSGVGEKFSHICGHTMKIKIYVDDNENILNIDSNKCECICANMAVTYIKDNLECKNITDIESDLYNNIMFHANVNPLSYNCCSMVEYSLNNAIKDYKHNRFDKKIIYDIIMSNK